jgi:copper resistance protein C
MVRHALIIAASVALSAWTLLFDVPLAFAHAHLVRAAPAAGSAVKDAPAEVTLTFSEKLEPAFTTAIIRDATGKQVDKADARVDKTDRTTVRVSLPPLTPGVYTVEWRVMSADTHKTNGNFTFKVGE